MKTDTGAGSRAVRILAAARTVLCVSVLAMAGGLALQSRSAWMRLSPWQGGLSLDRYIFRGLWFAIGSIAVGVALIFLTRGDRRVPLLLVQLFYLALAIFLFWQVHRFLIRIFTVGAGAA